MGIIPKKSVHTGATYRLSLEVAGRHEDDGRLVIE